LIRVLVKQNLNARSRLQTQQSEVCLVPNFSRLFSRFAAYKPEKLIAECVQ